MDIKTIEEITLKEIKKIAEENIDIKGYTCFFADLSNSFGYSVLVFKADKHIYYANDYELHHRNKKEKTREKTKEKLKALYIEKMNQILFTDEEIFEGAASYKKYKAKEYFLRNYWVMSYDRESIFGINKGPVNKSKYPFYDPISFCYLKNKDVLLKHMQLYKALKPSLSNLRSDPESFQKMISEEFANYEVCLSGRVDEALDAIGLKYTELESWQQKEVKKELNRQINSYVCG